MERGTEYHTLASSAPAGTGTVGPLVFTRPERAVDGLTYLDAAYINQIVDGINELMDHVTGLLGGELVRCGFCGVWSYVFGWGRSLFPDGPCSPLPVICKQCGGGLVLGADTMEVDREC